MATVEANALRAREISDQLAAAERAAQELAAHLVALDGESLTAVAGSVLRLMQLAESASVSLVAEAMARGVVDDSSAAGPAQWVGRLASGEDPRSLSGVCGRSESGPLMAVPDESRARQASGAASMAVVPGIDPAHAQRIVTVAGATREARNAILSTALSAGTISVAGARVALREVDRVMAVLPGATRDQVFGHFLELPSGASARMIRELTRRVVATYGDQWQVDGEHDRLARQESVNFTDLPCGLVRMMADLAPDHAQRVKHALSALSAPAKPSGCCAHPHHPHEEFGPASERRSSPLESDAVDDRLPGQRRADALLLLIESGARAVDADGDVVSTGGARIIVTVDHDVLVGRLGGVAVAEAGAALSASTVRRLACDAEIIPMVLGTASEPLDVGRAKRLVDKGLRRAVIHRDRHCTFPGCDRPPSWCDVHHVRPWWLGGGTSLSNSALLCRRHHTVVHRDGLVAAVDPSGVTWDLTAGRLPDRVTRAA